MFLWYILINPVVTESYLRQYEEYFTYTFVVCQKQGRLLSLVSNNTIRTQMQSCNEKFEIKLKSNKVSKYKE